jgi:uncharacterized protein YbcI
VEGDIGSDCGEELSEQQHLRVADGDRPGNGQQSAAVSNAIVSLFADYHGRGPTRARTAFGRDVVTVVLEETLTKAERKLVANGETDAVVRTRRIFQQVMRDDLIAAVERITGRQVVAFLSDHVTDPDVSVEVFVLAPNHAAHPPYE